MISNIVILSGLLVLVTGVLIYTLITDYKKAKRGEKAEFWQEKEQDEDEGK